MTPTCKTCVFSEIKCNNDVCTILCVKKGYIMVNPNSKCDDYREK